MYVKLLELKSSVEDKVNKVNYPKVYMTKILLRILQTRASIQQNVRLINAILFLI